MVVRYLGMKVPIHHEIAEKKHRDEQKEIERCLFRSYPSLRKKGESQSEQQNDLKRMIGNAEEVSEADTCRE